MDTNWPTHTSPMGMENGKTTLESSLSVSYPKLRTQSPKTRNCNLGHSTQRNENFVKE